MNYRKFFKMIAKLILIIIISLFFSIFLFSYTPKFLGLILPHASPLVINSKPENIIGEEPPFLQWWEKGFPFPYVDYEDCPSGCIMKTNDNFVLDLLIYFIFTFIFTSILYLLSKKFLTTKYKKALLIIVITIFFGALIVNLVNFFK